MLNYIGEIRLFAGTTVPAGWLPCDGRELHIDAYNDLYSLIMNTYGGNGFSTFALPNLGGRVPVGQTPGQGTYALGAQGGQTTVTLTQATVPAHNHNPREQGLVAMQDGVGTGIPAAAYFGTRGGPAYTRAKAKGDTLYGGIVQGTTPAVGTNQPHSNLQASVALSYWIATEGSFPSRP